MPALIFLASLLPGLLSPFGFNPWMAFQHEAFVFAGLAPAATLIIRNAWRTPIVEVRANSFTPLAVAFMAALVLQCILMPTARLGDAALGVVYLSGIWVAWQFGLQEKSEQRDNFNALAWTWLALSLISALMAVIQFFELEPALDPWVITPAGLYRATANLAQPNNLATFLLMGVGAAAWLCEAGAITGAFTTVCVAVLSLGVLTTQSRTAILSTIGLLILKHGIARKNMSTRISIAATGLWCVGLVLGSLAVRFYSTQDDFQLQAPRLSDGRLVIWHQLLVGLQHAPWFGYGWLQTPAAQQAGALQVMGTEQTAYSHNLVLDLCVWMGLPVGLLVSAAAAVWLFKRWQVASNLKTMMTFAFVLPLAVHSMLEMPFSYVFFLFPAAWVVGMIDRDTTVNYQVVSITRARLESLLGAGFIVLTVWIGLEYVKVEEDFRMARFEKSNVGGVPADYVRPSLVLLTQWDDLLSAMRTPVTRNMTDEQMDLLSRASQRFSWLPLHFSYAMALDLKGRAIEAAQVRQKIKGLFSPVVYNGMLSDYRVEIAEKYPELKNIQLE